MNIRNFIPSRRILPALLGLALGSIAWAQVASVRIVIIGDSTVCNYAASKYPWAGWGQEIGLYFKPGSVTVLNNAVGGRSSRGFVTKGQWATTSAALARCGRSSPKAQTTTVPP